MATERQAPDSIAASANYSTTTLGNIQDDPDSPDSNWVGAWDGNGNTDLRTTFPTPTGNPNVGADLQEFRVQIRKVASAGGNNADWSLELWENGSSVRVLATGTTAALDPGEVISGTWNANELGTADGSLVECRLLQTGGATGAGGSRRAVEVGAVEWNVDFDAGSTPLTVAVGDTANMDDGLGGGSGHSLTDDITFSDAFSLLFDYLKTLADITVLDDKVGVGVGHTLNDQMSLTDAIQSSFAAFLEAAANDDLNNWADQINTQFSFEPTPSDNIVLSDTVEKLFVYLQSVDDSINLLDTVSKLYTYLISKGDIFSLSDSIEVLRGYLKSTGDDLSNWQDITQQVLAGFSEESVSNDLNNWNDALKIGKGLRLTDDLTFSDATRLLFAHLLQIGDTASIDDTISLLLTYHIVSADQFVMSDASRALYTYLQFVGDDLDGWQDTTTRLLGYLLNVGSDLNSWQDLVTAEIQLPGGAARSVTDSLNNWAETISRALGLALSLGDTLSMVDALAVSTPGGTAAIDNLDSWVDNLAIAITGDFNLQLGNNVTRLVEDKRGSIVSAEERRIQPI